jgi:hypothetical protein
MKKFFAKALLVIDLWLVIVTSSIYIILYATGFGFDVQKLCIVLSSFILFNIVYLSTLLIVSSNKGKTIKKKEE